METIQNQISLGVLVIVTVQVSIANPTPSNLLWLVLPSMAFIYFSIKKIK